MFITNFMATFSPLARVPANEDDVDGTTDDEVASEASFRPLRSGESFGGGRGGRDDGP